MLQTYLRLYPVSCPQTVSAVTVIHSTLLPSYRKWEEVRRFLSARYAHHESLLIKEKHYSRFYPTATHPHRPPTEKDQQQRSRRTHNPHHNHNHNKSNTTDDNHKARAGCEKSKPEGKDTEGARAAVEFVDVGVGGGWRACARRCGLCGYLDGESAARARGGAEAASGRVAATSRLRGLRASGSGPPTPLVLVFGWLVGVG